MTLRAWRGRMVAWAGLLLVSGAAEAGAQGPLERLTIIAPAAPSGGSHRLAAAIRDALLEDGLVGRVEIVNSPGAGGTIGLAQLVSGHAGDARTLLVGGLATVYAVRANRATVSLGQATPLARLIGEHEVVAVSARSRVRTVEELAALLRRDPAAVAWVGGSSGGADQLFVTRFVRAIGADPAGVNFVTSAAAGPKRPFVLENHPFGVAVSGFANLAPEIESGKLRPLAVSSDERLPGLDLPTLRESGFDLTQVHWRGVFAPPGLTPDDRNRLSALVARSVQTRSWRAAVARHRWRDLYLDGQAFASFVADEQARAAAAPDPRGLAAAAAPGPLRASGLWLVRHRRTLAGLVAGAAGLAVAVAVLQGRGARRRRRSLLLELSTAQEAGRRQANESLRLHRLVARHVQQQFDAWGLTAAEREVASLMLRGLRHKEIARARGSSESTVRHQALGIYKKAGLEGRTDLAAFFLEDFLEPPDSASRRPA